MRQDDRSTDETSATRHLCAGIYLDREFRDTVIRKVHNDSNHRIAPSYGFDLVPVVEHARRAWALERAYQAGLLLVLVTGLITNPAATVMAACTLALVPLLVIVLRTTPLVLQLKANAVGQRLLRRDGPMEDAARLTEGARLIRVGASGCLLLVVAAVLGAHLLATPLSATYPAAAAMLLLTALMSATTATVRQLALNGVRKADSLRPTRLTKRLQVIDEQQSHPHVVYSQPAKDEDNDTVLRLRTFDDTTPYVGCGEIVHRWDPPLVVLLLRRGTESLTHREFQRTPFRAHELVDYLRTHMAPLGSPQDHTRLRGFEINDRVYMAETDVPADRDFLRWPPSPQEMNDIIDEPHGTTQHYLELCTGTSEVVTTVFLRVTVRGRALSLDFASCGLTPTLDEYQVPDRFKETGAGAAVRAALRGLRDLPLDASQIWKLGDVPMTLLRASWVRKDRSVVPRRGVLIGTKLSIREEKSLRWSESHVERVRSTVIDHTKIIERRILLAAEEFLKSRDVDTSEFRKRAASIISTNIYNTGNMNVQGSAIGSHAQAAQAHVRVTTAIANNAAADARGTGGDQG